jgi:hypothetical protein
MKSKVLQPRSLFKPFYVQTFTMQGSELQNSSGWVLSLILIDLVLEAWELSKVNQQSK